MLPSHLTPPHLIMPVWEMDGVTAATLMASRLKEAGC